MNMFRVLRADEIDCRISQIKEYEGKPTGLSLLLYKDARCDQNILDETVSPMNWKREHTRDNRNCIVSIWDENKQHWISKEDTGTESNTEAEKGLASDSFKRSCFCWGIGRELYTAPFIWVKDGDPKKDRFAVESITIENKRITALVIKNEKTGDIVYTFGKTSAKKTTPKKTTEPKAEAPKTEAATAPKQPQFPNRNKFLTYCKKNELDWKAICKELGLNGDSPDVDFVGALSNAVKKVAEKSAKKPEEDFGEEI